jgi:general stress protein 26
MPGYGIATDKKRLLSWRWALTRLTKSQNYLLVTVRPDGRPHVMPVWGVWLADRFYFGTAKDSVKGRNIAKNPKCVLCPGDSDEVVIVEGTVSLLKDKMEIKKMAAAYKRKYKFDLLSMDSPIYVVRPKVAFGQIEKTYTKTATRWKF